MSKVLNVILVVLLVAMVFLSGMAVGVKLPREPQLDKDLAIELAVAGMNRHDLAQQLIKDAIFPPHDPVNEHPEETERVMRATAKAVLLSPEDAVGTCMMLFGPDFMGYEDFQRGR
jgi:Na+-transporting NADH:ubiquinone oxidoreductase subunit NqrC